MKIKLKLKRFLLPALIILNLALIISVFKPQLLKLNAVDTNSTLSLTRLAEKVIEICRDKTYKPGCYDTEIPKLMSQISMEEAFAVTRLVQEQNQDYSYCHVLGHNIAAEEVKKNPAKWQDVIARCPSGMCSNGCLHGGFQERFRSETLAENQVKAVVEELKTACEAKVNWTPTGLEQASCYHALGHLSMYLTSADIDKSLTICDQIAIKTDGRNFTKVCYDGTFMQMFQPLEPEDFALIKSREPSLASVDPLCQKYSGQANASCIGESWPLFASDLVSKPLTTIDFCQKVESSFQQICYNGIFYIMTTQLRFESDKIVDYCSKLPSPIQGYCFSSAADRFIETDYKNISKAVELCSSSPLVESKNYCFEMMVSHASFNFHPGSTEFQNMCNLIPPPWKDSCLAST